MIFVTEDYFLLFKVNGSNLEVWTWRRQSYTWSGEYRIPQEEMRKFFPMNEEVVSHIIWLCARSLEISLYMRKILFSFLSVHVFLWIQSLHSGVSFWECNILIEIYFCPNATFHIRRLFWRSFFLDYILWVQDFK